MYSQFIEFPDLTEQITKLHNFPKIFNHQAKIHGKTASVEMRRGWLSVAAIDTGQYRQSIKNKVDEISQTHVRAIAETTVRSARGFPYPRALEESTRYHYRSTSRRGQRTAGQVGRKFKSMKSSFLKMQKQMTEAIIKKLVVD